MKKKELEILLEKLEPFPSPRTEIEQYHTPAPIAAELLHFALMHGDLAGTVYDLGCGTGILAIGAKLLGSKRVVGFDIDVEALKVARRNASKLGVDVEFVACRIEDVMGKADVVVMNPPFGAQKRGADRPFLAKAFEVAEVVYSIHNIGSYEFVKKFIFPNVITHHAVVRFPMKRTFHFHRKEIMMREVEIYRMERWRGT